MRSHPDGACRGFELWVIAFPWVVLALFLSLASMLSGGRVFGRLRIGGVVERLVGLAGEP